MSTGGVPDPTGELLSRFLSTQTGLQWLAVNIDAVEQRLIKLAERPPTLEDLNALILQKVNCGICLLC
jgi:hypothetical protein